MNITVMSWNTQTKPKLTDLALWDCNAVDFLAIQEPGLSATSTPACSALINYNMVYGGGKAVLYVHKRHGIGSWTPQSGEHWCSATLHSEKLTIYSIYNPNGATPASSPLQYVGEHSPDSRVVLAGDFNLHHPLWDHFDRTSTYSGNLLDLAHRLRLSLVTPKGECTRFRRNHRNSTIDLIWATQGMPVRYHRDKVKLSGSDHLPQLISIELGMQQPDTAPTPQWKMMDRQLVELEARSRFLPQPPPGSIEELDSQVDTVIDQLHLIATIAVPYRKRRFDKQAEWWTPEVSVAKREARRACRRFRSNRNNQASWQSLMEANKAQDRAIGEAKRASWRRFTEEASRDSSKLWRLEKWARTRSGLPPEPAQLPELQGDHPGDPVAATFEEKTQALAARFFPSQKADCTGIQDQQFHDDSFQASFQMDDPINEHEVKQAIQRVDSWSAPGLDGIPAGLLKACGSHLVQVLQPLIQASFDLEYFPKRFRTAVVAVVPKPNKTPAQRKKVGGWRPISLLNTVGKVFESIIGRRIASAAEQHHLFPDEQMGNRAQRSTMLAVKLVLESVRTAWSRKAVTSLLQLDLKGAYDSVDHLHLLNNLRHIGFPPKVVRWVHSFLSDRSAQLQFDGRKSSFIQLVVGVSQGSPLSPVLFLLYIASLYTRLKEKHGILVVGFSDDTNILSVGRDTAATVRQLEGAWKECEDWAKENGMAFQPEKSELCTLPRQGSGRDPTSPRIITCKVPWNLAEA